jgi:hypothetical protein
MNADRPLTLVGVCGGKPKKKPKAPDAKIEQIRHQEGTRDWNILERP